jgi:hypothetical protein
MLPVLMGEAKNDGDFNPVLTRQKPAAAQLVHNSGEIVPHRREPTEQKQ